MSQSEIARLRQELEERAYAAWMDGSLWSGRGINQTSDDHAELTSELRAQKALTTRLGSSAWLEASAVYASLASCSVLAYTQATQI